MHDKDIENAVITIDTLLKKIFTRDFPLAPRDEKYMDMFRAFTLILEGVMPQWVDIYGDRSPQQVKELNESYRRLLRCFVIVLYGQSHDELQKANEIIEKFNIRY